MQAGEGGKAGAAGRPRRLIARWRWPARGLLACVLAVALLHLALLARLGDALRFGSEAEPAGAAVRLRTLAPADALPADADAGATADAPAALPKPPAAEPARAEPAPPRAAALPPADRRPPGRPTADTTVANAASAASAPSAPNIAVPLAPTDAAPPAASAALAAAPEPPASAIRADASGPLDASPAGAEPLVGAAGAASAPPTLLAEGEAPPPVYATRLPPAATLRYEVRRGFLRGTGEIRWQPAGGLYTLTLEARIAGLTLLTQTSSGSIDGNGLAPERFVDQRARRPLQAANFRRDIGRIGFSGPAVQWPLLAGSQDRLSWLIQLAGIAAAQPELMVEGGSIAMVVVGARGDAAVWTLRVAGSEDIDTATGSVHAVKLVSRGRGVAGTSAEVWLDPARGWLPAHATLRNSAGASEYDLLLERVEPGS